MSSKIIFAVCIIALCLSGLESKPATSKWSRGSRGRIGKARVLSEPIPTESKGKCDFVVKTNSDGERELICVRKSEETPALNAENTGKQVEKCKKFGTIVNKNGDNELVCEELQNTITTALSGEKEQPRKCIKFEVIRNSDNVHELVCAEREGPSTPALNAEKEGEKEKCNKFDVILRADGVHELVCVESEVKSTPLNSEKERGKCTKFDVFRNSDNVYELVCVEREGLSTPALNAEKEGGKCTKFEVKSRPDGVNELLCTEREGLSTPALNAELPVPKPKCDKFVVIDNVKGQKELICQNDADSTRTLKYRRKNASTSKSSKKRSPFGWI